MSSLLDSTLPDGRGVGDIVFAPGDKTAKTFEFVDVGARNGSYILPRSYAARSRMTGFEPNRAEYEKLVNDRTDAKAAGLVEPTFRKKDYHPYALWSENAVRPLYLTVGAGAVTLMGPANERMTRNMWRERDRGKDFYEKVQKVVGTDSVECVTLDHIWREHKETIDILKLDAEGSELEILKGAMGLLRDKRVLLIKAEFLLLPFYESRVTLGHQQVLLDELGYRLIALDLNHFPYSWRKTSIREENDQFMLYAGDAVFVLDPDRNALDPDTMYRLGTACMAMGFNAFGLNLIRETGMVPPADIDAVEAKANRPPLLRRMRHAWAKFPDIAARLLHRL